MPLSLRDLGQKPVGSFRAAVYADARLLYDWRLDAESKPWWQGQSVTYEEHCDWLLPRLASRLIKVLIWFEDDLPAGMVRIDSNGELAFWCGDPDAAVRMLSAAQVYADEYGGRLKASVDQADQASIELLQEAGYELYPVKFLAYKP